MHTLQMNAQINENGILTVALSKEWAKQAVNVLLVIEPLAQIQSTAIIETAQRKKRLKNALNNAVALNIFEGVDGIVWQNEQRQDCFSENLNCEQ